MSDEPFEPLVPDRRDRNVVWNQRRGCPGVTGFFDLRSLSVPCVPMIVVFDEGVDDG